MAQRDLPGKLVMNLYHYSKEKLTLDKWQQRSPLREGDPYFKPCGLWVSADDYSPSWPEWCTEEDFCLGHLRYRHAVTLHTERVLLLDTVSKILDFGAEYPMPVHVGHRYGLDWPRITKEWAGVVIAPYQWSLRMADETCWYYCWDCAIRTLDHVEDNKWWKGESECTRA